MFITFEGGEGVGKTTTIKEIKALLTRDGYDVLSLHDPGGTILSTRIRELVKQDESVDICSVAQLFLFSAARAQLVHEIIIPALQNEKIVLCDRFSDSTIVYQGMVHNIADKDFVKMVNYASVNTIPTRTYLLDLDAKEGLDRVYKRSNEHDRFDSMPLDFHNNVRKCYLMLAERYKKRVVVVDASKPIEEVVSVVYNNLTKVLNKKKD